MARRLITLDASPTSVRIHCACGYTTLQLTAARAQAAADWHRATAHPRQAQYAASKRRSRARSGH